MATLPKSVIDALAGFPEYKRAVPEHAASACSKLGVEPGDLFWEFFERFEGPFGSEVTGFELLDVCEGEPSVVSATGVCRGEHAFPPRYLILTNLLGGGVLVYNVETRSVYNVGFEGGDELLREGNLEPEWNSFGEFLEEYFGRSRSG